MPNYTMKSIVYRGILSSKSLPATLLPATPTPAVSVPQTSVLVPATLAVLSSDTTATLAPAETHYSVIAQSREELQATGSSPSISMWPHLLASAQTQRLNSISIYMEKGLTPDAMRYLYLNDVALEIWSEMRGPVKVLSRLRRPPRGATLSFGMPFAD